MTLVLSPGGEMLAGDLHALLTTALDVPEPCDVVEWAEANIMLASESGDTPGPLRLSPQQRGVLRAMVAGDHRELVVPKGTRVGYSLLLGIAVIYLLVVERCLAGVALPTDPKAADWHEKYHKPYLRDGPLARHVLPRQKWNDTRYANGSGLVTVGAHKGDNLKSWNARWVAGDEIDEESWSDDAGGDDSNGDKIATLRERTARAKGRRRLVVGSSPKALSTSRVWARWRRSSRLRFHVPCPHCGEFQVLQWGETEVVDGVRRTVWGMRIERDADGQATGVDYVCRHHGCVIDESEKAGMAERGEWRPEDPAHRGTRGVVGMHMCCLVEGFAPWIDLATEFLEAKGDPAILRTFVNNKLGEPWDDTTEDDPGEGIEVEALPPGTRYDAPVPSWACVLTAGIDKQAGKRGRPPGHAEGPRVEVSVWAHGPDGRSALVWHEAVLGVPLTGASAERLDELRSAIWRRADGRTMGVAATCVDHGGGFGDETVAYCRSRSRKGSRVWPIKGRNLRKGTRSPMAVPTGTLKIDAVNMLCTGTLKDRLYRRIEDGQVEWPASLPRTVLEGLTCERMVDVGGAHPHWRNTSGNTGEPWDCAVYAHAALEMLQRSTKTFRDLSRLAVRLGAVEGPPSDVDRSAWAGPAPAAPVATGAPAPVAAPPSAVPARPVPPPAPVPAPRPAPGPTVIVI